MGNDGISGVWRSLILKHRVLSKMRRSNVMASFAYRERTRRHSSVLTVGYALRGTSIDIRQKHRLQLFQRAFRNHSHTHRKLMVTPTCHAHNNVNHTHRHTPKWLIIVQVYKQVQ